MADVQRLVRQWLETDAAFGVADVPLRLAATGSKACGLVAGLEGLDGPLPQAVMPSRQGTSPQAHPPSTTTFAVRGENPTPMQDAMPKRKLQIEMPPPPPGNINDLPPLTRREKEKRSNASKLNSKPLHNPTSTKSPPSSSSAKATPMPKSSSSAKDPESKKTAPAAPSSAVADNSSTR